MAMVSEIPTLPFFDFTGLDYCSATLTDSMPIAVTGKVCGGMF